MSDEDTRAVEARSAAGDPPFSTITQIRMVLPAFDDVERPMYRLLLTGWLDDHVDIWPEDDGHTLFAHAPIAAEGRPDAMAKALHLAKSALALRPRGSVIVQVQSIDWSAEDPAEGTEFWDPDDPPHRAAMVPI